MEFVFIVGIARTGSKIYMNSLNHSSNIDIVDEMHYLAPWYIRKDAVRALKLQSVPLTTEAQITKAIEVMYSGVLRGTFWGIKGQSDGPRQRLADIDRSVVIDGLKESAGTAESVFRTLLIKHARVVGKERAGAKFPVDINCVNQLMEWFPKAKFVHLIRDPRAIYGSMVSREFKGMKFPARRILAALGRLPYVVLQFRRAAQLHRDMCHSPNYYLSRFEDIVRYPDENLRKLCAFLDTEYRSEMLNIKKVDSSYPKKDDIGIDRGAVTQWQDHVLPVERSVLDRALRVEMRLFGYSEEIVNNIP